MHQKNSKKEANKDSDKKTEQGHGNLTGNMKSSNQSPSVENENENNKEKQTVQNIKELGTNKVPTKDDKTIQCITIIGEIEGHFVGNPQKKATKYEHVIPMLYSIEEDPEIKGILIILNTVGGDVEAGLAMAELINSISKKVVTLVLGGSHSIGVPQSTASFPISTLPTSLTSSSFACISLVSSSSDIFDVLVINSFILSCIFLK